MQQRFRSTSLRRLVAAGAGTLLLAPSLVSCGSPGADRASAEESAGAPAPTARWVDSDAMTPAVASLTLVRGQVDLDRPADRVLVDLEHARLVSIPATCRPSTVVRERSYLDGTHLECRLVAGATSVVFTAITVGETGDRVTGTVTARRSGRAGRTSLPERVIAGGEKRLQPDLRLLSSPDFLNADVGDLRRGPGAWARKSGARRSANSINADYRRTLDRVLADWEALDPAAVLVAGDLVDGRWGYDDAGSGNFGPVGTREQQRSALRRAARTYYPQWKQRFTERGLTTLPAMGDHEYGDNPFPRRKRELAADFRAEFAREFTTDRAGRPLFANHPDGPAATTAYAVRPSPDVQLVTIDVFDITPARARIGVDPQQLDWLREVLARAASDGVTWVIVQGHTPILGPVRARGSSLLRYPGGASSRLWKLLSRYGVDLYLAGEVHDTTALQQDGVVQISHGGAFQFGLTTALLMDFYGDRLYVTLRDYDVRHSDAADGSRLWETRRAGLPKNISLSGRPVTVGTATIADGRLVSPSGILVPPR